MDTDQRRTRLVEWLETVFSDVQRLLLDQHLFWELQAIIDANPKFADHPGLFNQWMASSFIQAAAVGVRRQAKSDDDSVSMKRFLGEVRKYPSLVSRDYYLAFFDDAPDWQKEEIGQGDFDRIAGEGATELPEGLIDDQIQRLQGAVAIIEHYVDRRVAHYDKRGLAKPIPTFNDLRRALATLEELVLFYWLLLKGASNPDGLRPAIQYDWQSVFGLAWVDRSESDTEL